MCDGKTDERKLDLKKQHLLKRCDVFISTFFTITLNCTT